MRFGILQDHDGAARRRAPTGGWARFGDVTAVWADDAAWPGLASGRDGTLEREHPAPVDERDLHLVTQVGRSFQREHPEVPVLLDKGRFLVAEITPERAAQIARSDVCFGLRPLPSGVTVLERAAPRAGARLQWVQALVDQVSTAAYRERVAHLVSYPTRHSLGSHHEAAVSWARDALDELGYATRVDAITVGDGASRNLVADRVGGGSSTRRLALVVAHLDSINQVQGPSGPAPGADDNASGAAGLLEIARVLADHRADGDLRLILFGGEEQGLHGSTQYVAGLSADDRARLVAVINMDMIAARNTPQPTVLIEGAAVSKGLMDDVATAAATYTGLEVQTSLSPYNSDHVPFIDAGLPAVLTIEGADDANAAVHTADDTIDRLDEDLPIEIVRANLAAVADLLGTDGPSAPPEDACGPGAQSSDPRGGAAPRGGESPPS